MDKNWIIKYITVAVIVMAIIAYLIIAVEGYKQKRRIERWGDGMCEDCNIRYELKAATNTIKYYVCNGCGKEVAIY